MPNFLCLIPTHKIYKTLVLDAMPKSRASFGWELIMEKATPLCSSLYQNNYLFNVIYVAITLFGLSSKRDFLCKT